MGVTQDPLGSPLNLGGLFVYLVSMAKNMSGVEIRPTPAGTAALSEGTYEDVGALPPRMKQYRVARRVKGKRVRTSFHPTVAAAEKQFKDLAQRSARGTSVDAKSAKVLVSQYVETWLARRDALVAAGALAAETVANNRMQLEVYVNPELGYRPLSSLTGDEILEWRSGLSSVRDGTPLSEASRVKATAALSTMLADAVDDGLIDSSPMRKRSGRAAVPRSKGQQKANLYLDPRQLLRLSQAVPVEHELVILVAGLCGLRIGELAALLGSSVTDEGDLVVDASSDRNGVRGATKTYGTRRVRMPEVVAGRVIDLAHTRSATEPLFQTVRGGAVNRTNFRTRIFGPARDAAAGAVSTLQRALSAREVRPGVMCRGTLERLSEELWGATECGPREWRALGVEGPVTNTVLREGDQDFSAEFTFHDLRHTAASLAISSGANIKAVQVMLGHRTASVTLDTYAGLLESDRVSTAAGIGTLFEGAAL